MINLGDKFKNLSVNVVSASDIVIMKLSIQFSNIGEIRSKDIYDIENINLSKKDIQLINDQINIISKTDVRMANSMRRLLYNIRPETDLYNNFKGEVNIEEYKKIIDDFENKYNFHIKSAIKDMFKHDIVRGEIDIDDVKNVLKNIGNKMNTNNKNNRGV